MAYTLPNFNLVIDQFRPPAAFPGVPTSSYAGQFYVNSRVPEWAIYLTDYLWRSLSILRVPAGTDVVIGDVVEIGSGSGRFYVVCGVEPTHLGFANEYLSAYVQPVVAALLPQVQGVGSISSLVPAATSGNVNGYTPVAANLVCVCVAYQNGVTAFGQPLLGVNPMANQAQAGPIVLAGQSITVVVSTATVPAGNFNTQSISVGAVSLLHHHVAITSLVPIGNDTNGAAVGVVAPVTFPSGGVNVRTPEGYVGGFGMFNPAGLNTWAAPMANLTVDLQDLLAGTVCRSTVGGFLSQVLAVQNFTVAPVNPPTWAGAGCSVG